SGIVGRKVGNQQKRFTRSLLLVMHPQVIHLDVRHGTLLPGNKPRSILFCACREFFDRSTAMRDATIRMALIFTVAAGMLLSAGGASMAANVKYKANMKGSSEVPPTDSSGTGKASVTYDTKSKKLSWVVTYSGLSGEPTAAHFHGPAAPGKNAGPVVDI